MKTILIAFLIVVLGIGGWYYGQKQGWWKQAMNNNTGNIATISASPTQKVGGDTDKYGCKTSAGYAWCEAKSKCLRPWEEECERNLTDEEEILKAFASKYSVAENKIKLEIKLKTEAFARGNVEFSPGGPEYSGMFLVTKGKGGWEIVFDGNGVAKCKEIEAMGFPKDMLSGVCY